MQSYYSMLIAIGEPGDWRQQRICLQLFFITAKVAASFEETLSSSYFSIIDIHGFSDYYINNDVTTIDQ